MLRPVLVLLRIPSKLLNRLFNLCWLVPEYLSGDERILRAVYTPLYFDKNNKLKPTAFHPSPHTVDISVMRCEYLGVQFCKQKALAIENPAARKNYSGFAVLAVRAVRRCGLDVVDSRAKPNYCGHADIKLVLGEAIDPQEPLSAIAGERLLELKKMLVGVSNYTPDPNPRDKEWRGGKLKPPKEQKVAVR